MSFNNRFRNALISTLFIIFFVPSLLLSQNISLTIGDASGRLGEKLVPLDIRISNVSDTIAGFQIWLQLDRPDLVKFQEGAILGTYLYDTSTYIMPTWNTIINSLGGFGADLLLTSIRPILGMTYINPPQNNELLIRLYLEVVDTLPVPPSDSVVNILLQTEFLSHFSFSTPQGQSIGLSFNEFLDSTCYECTSWNGEECLNWEILPQQPIDTSLCDSIDIVLDSFAVLDTTYWQISNGTFTLTPTCGFSASNYDLSDIVALVAFMFSEGPSKTLAEADYNCDCSIDVSDIVGFIGYMFTNGNPPGCQIE